jgi:hypothetical protein
MINANLIISVSTSRPDEFKVNSHMIKSDIHLLNVLERSIDLPFYKTKLTDNIVKITGDAIPNTLCVLTCKNADDAKYFYDKVICRQQQLSYKNFQ